MPSHLSFTTPVSIWMLKPASSQETSLNSAWSNTSADAESTSTPSSRTVKTSLSSNGLSPSAPAVSDLLMPTRSTAPLFVSTALVLLRRSSRDAPRWSPRVVKSRSLVMLRKSTPSRPSRSSTCLRLFVHFSPLTATMTSTNGLNSQPNSTTLPLYLTWRTSRRTSLWLESSALSTVLDFKTLLTKK